MGFIASYKRLSRRSRLILGLVGIAIGLAGPYLVPSFPEPEKPEENIESTSMMIQDLNHELFFRLFSFGH